MENLNRDRENYTRKSTYSKAERNYSPASVSHNRAAYPNQAEHDDKTAYGKKRQDTKPSVKLTGKSKLYYVILFIIAAVIIILLDIMFIAVPDRKSSDTENRNLAQAPKLTFATLTNGRFEKGFEDYVADQFPMRDSWVKGKTFIDRLTGKTESNGVFLCKDGFLIQKFTAPTDEKYDENISKVTDFADAHSDLDITALIAPTAISVYKDLLPANSVTDDEDLYMDRIAGDLSAADIEFIDVRSSLLDASGESQVYYRTDHHWTTAGAYAAYRKLASSLGLSGRELRYSGKKVTDSFTGTLASTSGFRTEEQDSIEIYIPETPVEYSVLYTYDGLKTASFYKTENLEKKDKYTVFFNGNHPEIVIETDSSSKESLLVFKDSYANCFVPFLAADYRKIVMVDPRYYTGDIESLIETEGITDVLYLYNIENFLE